MMESSMLAEFSDFLNKYEVLSNMITTRKLILTERDTHTDTHRGIHTNAQSNTEGDTNTERQRHT